MYEVVFTQAAEETYDAITDQLLEHWGINILLEFQALVSMKVKILLKSPFLYQIIDDDLKIRRCPIHRNCSLIYRVNEKKVEVICFWDNRQESIF